MIEVLVASLLLGATPPQEIVVEGSRLRGQLRPASELVLGDCGAGDQSIDMRRVMFLENQQVTTNEVQPRTIAVRGETATIKVVDANGQESTSYVPVDALIDDTADLDVQLKLAIHDGELMVYWRETFQNRIYRQGLVRLVGQDFVPFCEGGGGIERSH